MLAGRSEARTSEQAALPCEVCFSTRCQVPGDNELAWHSRGSHRVRFVAYTHACHQSQYCEVN
jgi:hypothetical protein